jgi:hypothetical protein
VVEHLLSKHEALNSNPSPTKIERKSKSSQQNLEQCLAQKVLQKCLSLAFLIILDSRLPRLPEVRPR